MGDESQKGRESSQKKRTPSTDAKKQEGMFGKLQVVWYS